MITSQLLKRPITSSFDTYQSQLAHYSITLLLLLRSSYYYQLKLTSSYNLYQAHPSSLEYFFASIISRIFFDMVKSSLNFQFQQVQVLFYLLGVRYLGFYAMRGKVGTQVVGTMHSSFSIPKLKDFTLTLCTSSVPLSHVFLVRKQGI